jgi:hypothetical protein
MLKALFLFLQHEHNLLEKVILVCVIAEFCFCFPHLKYIPNPILGLCIENILGAFLFVWQTIVEV